MWAAKTQRRLWHLLLPLAAATAAGHLLTAFHLCMSLRPDPAESLSPLAALVRRTPCSEPPDAGRLAAAFPERVRQAAVHRAVVAEGSRTCLVHIRQVHAVSARRAKEGFLREGFSDRESDSQVLRMYMHICECQKEICGLIELFAAELGVRCVYCEGVTDDLSTPEAAQQYDLFLRHMMAGIPEQLREGRYSPGGAMLLGREGKVRIMAADDEQRLDTAASYVTGSRLPLGDEPQFLQLLGWVSAQSRREQWLVQRVAEDGPQIAVVVFGAAHDFEAEVLHWNAGHPERTMSLVVVTPRAVDHPMTTNS